MTNGRTAIALAVTIAALLLATAGWPTHAQGPGQERRAEPATIKEAPRVAADPVAAPIEASSERTAVAVALTRPAKLPFREGTTLEGLADHLRAELGAPVVLDVAALNRLKITPGATVRLELDGVRLQTGLKLLLDQVGMTYRVIPEDNLLLLTDLRGSENPVERSLEELRALRHDVSDLRVMIEEIYDAMAPQEIVPSTRNPTIIEEMPAPKAGPEEPVGKARPG